MLLPQQFALLVDRRLQDAMTSGWQGQQGNALWASHRDAAVHQMVSVQPNVLEGVDITLVVSRGFAWSVHNFATHVNSNGEKILEDSVGFDSELVA